MTAERVRIMSAREAPTRAIIADAGAGLASERG